MTNNPTPAANDAAPTAIDSDVTAELALLLARAGIVLPAGKIAEVAAEYATFKDQLALVNGAYTAQDEPAMIFVAGLKADKS